jgi:hypothetical protein
MVKMMIWTLILCVGSCSGNAQSDATKPDVYWSANPTKASLRTNEPIVVAYEIKNLSKTDLWVLKSLDGFASVRLKLYDPDNRLMKWNGAQFTFKYDESDLVSLKPGQSASGTFTIPANCPNAARIEKGGFCFEKKGTYVGTAEYRMGMNAFYHRHRTGILAEGPYKSQRFTFSIQ